MPLNKLENFIKNTEGRILYVNPNDLDATDAIENQGNSLTKPFKTLQRALLESARFSYLKGSGNDLLEKTTILLFPGEHVVDNRPGFGIKNSGGTATAVSPNGSETTASSELSLTTNSVFDLTQTNNILYKFNSTEGGVIVPRGVSIVGLDLRKTKIRPKYVPNPTDPAVRNSAVFRVTGACYFWQFSIFDGSESGLVYTDPINFSSTNQSKPTFSHHKLTVFEYADGVNVNASTGLTDLDMYYSKLSNAFNLESGRNIDQKFPENDLGFAKMRPEWEIVGAFAADPVSISTIISGDGVTPSNIVTVTTTTAHNLSTGNPIKIDLVDVADYNISTTVQNVISATQFTYVLPFVNSSLNPSPSAPDGKVTIETDTVSGASPYIFNVSLRSVWGMNGMHADGAKASGFRSMVVAQFTAVSLQKDDRAFVKYDKTNRVYNGITISKVTGASLSSGSSSVNAGTVYHLDSEATYRQGWESSHIKASNDGFIQIVSVFAIGFTRHFDARSGSDFSVTNSNSNFGQLSLASSGFRKEAFNKDNRAYITSIITPRSLSDTAEQIEWVGINTNKTKSVGVATHLYLQGYNDFENKPPEIVQGYRIGAKVNDVLYITKNNTTYSADILMADALNSSVKEYVITSGPSSNVFTIGSNTLQTGEEVILISDNGDLPENIIEHISYYIIKDSATTFRLASSLSNAQTGTAITLSGGSQLRVLSRVSDKDSGDIGSPIQWDEANSGWYLTVASPNTIYTEISTGTAINEDDITYVNRTEDTRSLDEKLYKIRVVIPKELDEAKNPEEGFVIQESSYTGLRTTDFSATSITAADYLYNRNPRFITTCTYNSGTGVITVISDLPHNLEVGERVTVLNVTSSDNLSALENVGYNGTFEVVSVVNDKTFTYGTTDVSGVTHTPGTTSTNNTNIRNTSLPRFTRNDWKGNYYIYRSETITQHIPNVQDGIYHFYVLNSSNTITEHFTTSSFSQNVRNLYPELDRDNNEEDPKAAKTYAKRFPVGDVVTNDLKKSITRESADKLLQDTPFGIRITGVTTAFTSDTEGTATLTFNREHQLEGIVNYSELSGGSGYTDGTYYNVQLFNDGTTTWDGATARVVVSGGSVTTVDIISGGSGYTNGEELDFNTAQIGAGVGAGITISTSGISTAVGNGVQIAGIGTTAGGYFRIASIPAKNQVAIAITDKDPKIVANQYLFNIGHETAVSSSSYSSSTGTLTVVTSLPHGLSSGNKFRVLSSSNANLGDYFVSSVGLGTTTFQAVTNTSISPSFVIKHGTSVNNATSDINGENLSVRGVSFYDNESLILVSTVSTNQLKVSTINSGISTVKRFPLGSYIQVDNEIMRVSSSTLSGTNNDEITVIRGVLGTPQETHANGSLIKKIRPYPVEFHRPSYVRASGHTFEYLGFGPGNYSTSLPQVQVRSLTEKEEYLAQAQERDGGIVVYTGMNNDGDFYIGNKKINSATGQETLFDIPVPTITGLDPSRLSVVFDEVIAKERILVEGGNSGQILSQFGGPVNFNKPVKIKEKLTVNGKFQLGSEVNVDIQNTTQSNTESSGALTVKGGAGVGGNLNVGGNSKINGNANIVGILTVGSSSVTINGTTNQINVGSASINASGISLSGIVTATSFSGNLALSNVTGLGANVAAFLADPTSDKLKSAVTDGGTGTGALVLASSPTLTTPSLGAATATSINKLTITAPASSATLTIANGKTLTASNTVTLSGTDGVTLTYGSGGTVAYKDLTLAQFAITSAAQFLTQISGTTGTGDLVFASSPTLSNPTIGSATATQLDLGSSTTRTRLTNTGLNASVNNGSTYRGVTASAWAEFDSSGTGTGTPTIYHSFNVGNVSRVNTGEFTITFTNNLTSDNYIVIGNAYGDGAGGNNAARIVCPDRGSFATSSFKIIVNGGSSLKVNSYRVFVAVFGP